MSSSPSSQQVERQVTDSKPSWRRSLVAFLLLTAVFNVSLFVGVLLIDPYSTGRFALTQNVDIATNHFRFSRVGIARDQRFNGALIGASSSHVLDPRVIGEQTGWRIAQLTVSGASAQEQLIVARAFDRHHQEQPTLLILVLDGWCGGSRRGNDADGPENVPAWLYEGSTSKYLAHILTPHSVETAVDRLLIWLGLEEPVTREDGHEVVPRSWPQRDLSTLSRPYDAQAASLQAPGLLARHLAGLAGDTRVMLVFGPQYAGAHPVAGSPADLSRKECKRQISELAASRPNTGYLDLLTENDISGNPEYFWDGAHYKYVAAKLVENAVVSEMRDQGIAVP